MIIKGTNQIKGVLDLSSIGQQLTKGQSVSIKNTDFMNSDIQTSLKMGWITAENQPSVEEQEGEEQVLCLNAHNKPLGLMQFPTDIPPGGNFYLTKTDLNSSNIKIAIQQGMITVMTPGTNVEMTETTLNISKDLMAPDDGIMSDEMPDTNEELSVPLKTKLLPPKKEIKDNKAVVWNKAESVQLTDEEPRGVKGVRPASKVITSAHPDEEDSNQGDPRRHTIVMDPTGRAKKGMMKKGITDTLSFVDNDEQNERIKAHPILGKKPALPQNNEDLIVEDDAEANRIKTHKILGKSDEDNAFING